MTKLATVLIVTVVLLPVRPAPSYAQTSDCYDWNWCDPVGHMVCGFSTNFIDPPYHCQCWECHPPYSQCHTTCLETDEALHVDPLERESYRLTYSEALKAARAGLVSKVVELAPLLPWHVSYNPRRFAIQIKACRGESIVASLPVPAVIAALTSHASSPPPFNSSLLQGFTTLTGPAWDPPRLAAASDSFVPRR